MRFTLKIRKTTLKKLLIFFYLACTFYGIYSLSHQTVTAYAHALYKETYGFHDCISPQTPIITPLGIMSYTSIDGKTITAETTPKDLGYDYGSTFYLSRFFVMGEQVSVCPVPTLNALFSVSQEQLDSTRTVLKKTTPRQTVKLYDSPDDIFTIDVNICEEIPIKGTDKTETLCNKGDYTNINQALGYGKKYAVMTSVKDGDTLLKSEQFSIETVDYIHLTPISEKSGMGHGDTIQFKADQSLKTCIFEFKRGETDLPFAYSIESESTVIVDPTENLSFDTAYTITGACSSDESIMKESISFSFTTTPQLSVVGYSPTFAYDAATICIDFNAPVSWGVEQITLDGVAGKFGKSSETKVCAHISNGGSNKTVKVTVPISVGSRKAGPLAKAYANKTTINNYPISSKLLPAAFYYQPYSLSCEATSIRMALSAYGIYTNEGAIMGHIGYDAPTAKQCSDGSALVSKANGILGCVTGTTIWGDPTHGFVGELNGLNGSTGWGVDNGPAVRGAKAFAGNSYTLNGADWKTPLQEVGKGHPVVYWAENKSKTAAYTECWYSTEGRYICWKSTHVKTIVGYTYNSETGIYSGITIYDPLYGILKLSQNEFINSWYSYGGMGIVVVR